jgi:hypothetical protein
VKPGDLVITVRGARSRHMWGDRDSCLLAWPIVDWGPEGWEPAVAIPWGSTGIVIDSDIVTDPALRCASILFPQGYVKCPVIHLRPCKGRRT